MTDSKIVEILLEQNDETLATLPEAIRNAIAARRSEISETKRKAEEEKRKAEVARRAIEEKEMKENHKLIYPTKWASNIPRNRRFVMAWRKCRVRNLRNELVDEIEYCPIDVLRGYSAPYFGYFKYVGVNAAWREGLHDAIFSHTDIELLKVIKSEYDFFRLEYDDKYFGICEYEVVDGVFRVTNHLPCKSLEEHQKDLKREFGSPSS